MVVATGSENTRLRDLRQQRGLAIYGLAVRARCSPSTIGAAERWGYRPSSAVCDRIAAALEVTVEDIWPERQGVVCDEDQER
jgi:DNA-binding XRE family transcriptional regulator